MLGRLIGEDIEIKYVLDPRLPPLLADASQIEQVILNFAINARDAMPNGGTLTIETADMDLDEVQTRQRIPLKPGRHVRLNVTDTGIGMDSETLSHIFEPFFTTKGPDRGTGLGLATVYGIVTQSGGHVSVYSELGHGTNFCVYLPVAVPASTSREQEEVAHRDSHGTETILLVEDLAPLRLLTRKLLEQAGYTVLEAEDGQQALEVARGREDEISLLVTDVVLPKLNGPDVAKSLLARRPGLKLLYVSGYADHAVMHKGVMESGSAFLQKPFSAEKLTGKVRELLDAPAGFAEHDH
jgi:CheY-like chemotaxis protein